MASSGGFNTNKYYTSSSGSIGLNLTWYIVSQSVETNTTVIRWELKSNGTMSRNMSVIGGPITVEIGGIRVLNQTGRFSVFGGGRYYQASTVEIQHDDDGTKTIDMSVRAALYNSQVNCTGSANNVVLDPITRCAYITDVSNFTDEANPVLNYGNPLGDLITSTQACISLTDSGVNPAIAYRDIAINGSSYTFVLTEAERNLLRAECPNSDTLDVYFIIKSIMNGDTFYSKKVVTMTVVNDSPTIVNAQYYDTNADIIAVTNDPTKIVQTLSTVEFKFGYLTALKYATLVSASITINGVTKTVSLSGTSQLNVTKLFGTINVTSSLPASIDVVDSRGNHTKQELTINIYGWSVPTGAISLSRINNFETDCTLKVQASYSSISGQNSVTITYQAKRVSDADYGPEVTIQDNTLYIIQLDNTYEWVVRVKITDEIGGTTTYNLPVGKGIPIVFFDRLHRSLSINCFPTRNNSIEVAGTIYQSNPTEELFSGSFNSGSVTFPYGTCSYYIVKFRTASDGLYQTMTIPISDIGAIDTPYQFNTELNFFSFELRHGIIDGADVVTMTFRNKSSGSTGYIEKVYGAN